MKVDGHDAPVLINVSSVIENVGHFIRASTKFTSLQKVLSQAACQLINSYLRICSTSFDNYNNKNKFYASSLVKSHLYMSQPLVETLIVKQEKTVPEDFFRCSWPLLPK